MENINVRVRSRAPLDNLFALAQTAYDFVDAMPNIKKIMVLEETEDRKRSKAEWILDVPIPGRFGKMAWIKEASWDDANHKCDIRLSPDYKGIVKKLDGTWKFTPCGDGTEMNMLMDFRVSHPLVSRRVHDIFVGIMKKNLESLMLAIKRKAESSL
ncbi:MAG: SRPBCC family protein [bacterium]